jgi:hypothetical protein
MLPHLTEVTTQLGSRKVPYNGTSIYGSTALVYPGRSFTFVIYTQSVGLLRRGISRRKAATYTGQQKHIINAQRHPCLEWDSNPRSQRSNLWRQCMP